MAVTKAKPTARPAPTGNARAHITADELKKLIAEAAYYRAKQRGFEPGFELQDWVEAEAEVKLRVGRPA